MKPRTYIGMWMNKSESAPNAVTTMYHPIMVMLIGLAGVAE